MRLTFYGAAGEVTGSQHLLELDGFRCLFDCGLFQGRRSESREKNELLHCRPSDLDAVFLSHAHIDHCGRLPQLIKEGFEGPIFCTPTTSRIAELMLRDSAYIQQEDAKYLSKKLPKGSPRVDPLYTIDDAVQTIKQFEPISYHTPEDVFEGVNVQFHDAGHILGSAITELTVRDGGKEKRVVFTGDLGRRGMPLLRDPEPVDAPDVLISECLYAGRVHPPPADLQDALKRQIDETFSKGGRLILPAFSLGRTQQVLYFLNELSNAGELPEGMPIVVDSPLATKLTDVFRDAQHIMDKDVQDVLKYDDDVLSFPTLAFCRRREDSIALNHSKQSFVVISASGMCENGRVVHHLKHSIEDDRNTVGLLGYQAPGTLGSAIAERRKTVNIFGRPYELNANVEQLSGLSAHADTHDIKWWFDSVGQTGSIGQLFMVHGEHEGAEAMRQLVGEHCSERPVAPTFGDSFEV